MLLLKTNDDLDMVKQKMHTYPGKELLDLMLGVNLKGKNPSTFFCLLNICLRISWSALTTTNLYYFVFSIALSEITTMKILKFNETRALAVWNNHRG